MAINSEKTVRKLYALPKDLVERIEAYQKTSDISSEAAAVRYLLDLALRYLESPEELAGKLRQAEKDGRSLSWIVANLLEPHPLFNSATFTVEGATIELFRGDTICLLHGGEWTYVPRQESDAGEAFERSRAKLARLPPA